MTNNVRDRPIEDLEVSVRTSGFLDTLQVRTVGELLDLPRIELPTSWSEKMQRLVAAELTEVFAELGVSYQGAIV